MIQNWIKLYRKHFMQSKLFSILNYLGLSLGIAVVILVLLLQEQQMSYNRWNPYKDRIFEVNQGPGFFETESGVSGWFPAPFANELDKLDRFIDSYIFYYEMKDITSVKVQGRTDFITEILEAQKNVFDFLPFNVVAGSVDDYLKYYTNSIALEKNLAKDLFSDDKLAIGQNLIMEDGQALTVRVVYDLVGNSSLAPKAIYSSNLEKEFLKKRQDNWGDYNYQLLIRLKPGVSIQSAKDPISQGLYAPILEMRLKNQNLSKQEFIEKFITSPTFVFHELDSVHLNPKAVNLGKGPQAKELLNILIGVGFTLLTLCVLNSLNLSFVMAFKKSKEIGIRKTFGASKIDIVKQSIFEAIIITTISFIIAFGFVEVFLPYFNLYVNENLELSLYGIYPLIVALFILIFFILGVFPGLFLASFDVNRVLKGTFTKYGSGISVRNLLLVVQFIIAFFFLSTGIFIQRQVNYLIHQDLGFSADQVVNIKYFISDVSQRYNKFESIQDDILKIRGVQNAALHSVSFGGENKSSSSNYVGENYVQSHNVAVSHDFLDVFGIELAQGRFFQRELSSDIMGSVLVNEAFVEALNLSENLIGKELQWNNRYFKIIGVVKNFNHEGFSNEIVPATYFHYKSVEWFKYLTEYISIKVNTQDIQQTLMELENFWIKRVEQVYPISYSFANQDFAKSYKKATDQSKLFLVLVVISSFVALLGLTAIVSFTLESRLREISIRKTLGAENWDLVWKLAMRFIGYCILGFTASIIPTYYVLNKWLQEYVVRINIDFSGFLISFILLFSISMGVVFFRAYKATRVDILKYIKDS
ncbi:ABC transporter permease [Myroides sp. LJL119]